MGHACLPVFVFPCAASKVPPPFLDHSERGTRHVAPGSAVSVRPAASRYGGSGFRATVIMVLPWSWRLLMNQKNSAMPHSEEAGPPPALPICISPHCHRGGEDSP